jgi:hypothetical protein
MVGAFEILSIDPDKKRIGIALVEEGSARARGVAPGVAAQDEGESAEREDVPSVEGFGSLADKLRGALKPREK